MTERAKTSTVPEVLDDAVASDRSMINQTGAARNSPKVPNGVIRMGEASTRPQVLKHEQDSGYRGFGRHRRRNLHGAGSAGRHGAAALPLQPDRGRGHAAGSRGRRP